MDGDFNVKIAKRWLKVVLDCQDSVDVGFHFQPPIAAFQISRSHTSSIVITNDLKESQRSTETTQISCLQISSEEFFFEDMLLRNCKPILPLLNNVWHLDTSMFEIFKTIDEDTLDYMMIWYIPKEKIINLYSLEDPIIKNVNHHHDQYNEIKDKIIASISDLIEVCVLKDLAGIFWLLVVVPNQQWRPVVHFIRHCFPWIRFCVREEGFHDSNYELVNDMEFTPNYDVTSIIETYSPYCHDVVQAICQGPSLINNALNTLWIFSKFKGFLPLDFPSLPEDTVLLGGSKPIPLIVNFEKSDLENGFFAGLRMEATALRYHHNKPALVRQSCGLRVSFKNDSNQTCRGILTSRHGLLDNEEMACNIDSLLVKGHVHHLMIGEEPFAYMDPDFTVIAFPEIQFDLNTYVAITHNTNCSYESVDLLPVAQILSDFTLLPPRINKSGGTTGFTTGKVIGSIAVFHRSSSSSSSSKEINNNNNFFTDDNNDDDNIHNTTFKKCKCTNSTVVQGMSAIKYLLVYDTDTTFAAHGDSGSLCWFQNDQSNAVAVGLLIKRLDAKLYLILPLTYIDEMCKLKGMELAFEYMNKR